MPPTKTSIGDYCPKVKSLHSGSFRLPKVLAVRRSDSPCRVFLYLYTISDQDGFFELDAAKIAEQTSLSRKTVYKWLALLQRAGLLTLYEARRGRGKHSVYRMAKDRSHAEEKCHPSLKKKDIRTVSKDAGASKGVQKRKQFPASRRQPLDYQGVEAQKVQLIQGARFYRQIMKTIRLGLEEWTLSEPVRDAIEGFFGNRIDGASLAYARQLRDRIWGLRAEIERLAAQGASPRRVCSFVAGRLAGIPDKRSRREVLKRTAALMNDVEHIERRIVGLKAWLRERVEDYQAGRVCARCGYQHTEQEYHSGYRDDGSGLVCFGFARIKLEELAEQRKLRARTERCRQCGGPLVGGHVEGLCWTCYNAQGAAPIKNALHTRQVNNVALSMCAS